MPCGALVFASVLAVYKPWGATPYGRRFLSPAGLMQEHLMHAHDSDGR